MCDEKAVLLAYYWIFYWLVLLENTVGAMAHAAVRSGLSWLGRCHWPKKTAQRENASVLGGGDGVDCPGFEPKTLQRHPGLGYFGTPWHRRPLGPFLSGGRPGRGRCPGVCLGLPGWIPSAALRQFLWPDHGYRFRICRAPETPGWRNGQEKTAGFLVGSAVPGAGPSAACVGYEPFVRGGCRL